MKRLVLCLVLAVLAMTLAGACGGDKSVGSEEILDFEEQEESRLGGSTTTAPAAAAPTTAAPAPAEKGAIAPTTAAPAAAPATTAPPRQAAETFFEVTLVDRHPYFEPGDQLAVAVGTTIRVTNRDATAERPSRSFTASDGAFDSGMLKPGESWTHKFTAPGTWNIVDRAAPFITATLEVR